MAQLGRPPLKPKTYEYEVISLPASAAFKFEMNRLAAEGWRLIANTVYMAPAWFYGVMEREKRGTEASQ